MPRDPAARPRLVVVGNGMAGMRALEELVALAPDLYDVTVFGAEPHPNYNRILLSPVLAGEQAFDDIVLNPLAWYREHGVTLHAGKRVAAIDRAAPRRRGRGRHRGGLRPPADRHGQPADRAADPGPRPAGGDRLPRHRGYASDDRRGRARRTRGGDRRRVARAGSGQRAQAPRHGGHGRAPRAVADGAPARQDRGRPSQDRVGGARHRLRARAPDGGDRRWRTRKRGRRTLRRRRRGSRPISS